jgi:glycosyltransferase involved in cell wall biosynthesis
LTLNLLITTTSYPPAIGGAQLHTHQIARRLTEQHSLHVLTLWDENRTDWLLGTTINAPDEPKSYQIEGVPVDLITLSQSDRHRLWPYVLGYYAFKPPVIRHIAGMLAAQIEPFAGPCHLIHNARIGREPMSFASLQVARKLNIPFVFVPYHHPRWVGWNYREYHNLYRQADALMALTQAEKQTLIELGVKPERIFVTGNGPNLAETANPDNFWQNLSLPPETPLILFLGQKYRYKGIEALTAAAKLVWAKSPEAHFVFIGPRTPFSEKFFAHQKDPRLIELGTVDLQQKTEALAACTMLCLPSTQESFGGVFTEAWMMGKPVIGADIPAISEVIDNEVNGYLLQPKAEIIAERICYLLDNPALAQQMGQAGRAKTLQQYSWGKLAQKTEAVYTQVLQGV